MEEEFYASVKLISGEELVAKVCYLPDDDKLLLEKPLQVELAKQRRGQLEVSGFSLKEWMTATFEELFIINRSHVLTMTEVDSQIQDFYEKTLIKLDSAKNVTGRGNKLPRGSGYLGLSLIHI